MMKKLFVAIALAFIPALSHAGIEADNYIPISSYSDVATPDVVMFTSASVKFIGVQISSPAANGYLVFYRSTTSVFTANLATQTLILTDYLPYNQGSVFVPLFEMENTSYTFMSKVGAARLTIWMRCKDSQYAPNSKYKGFCPGLGTSGMR